MQPPIVHLVGAGPGDPELLTLKAARLIQLADTIVHDRLIGEGVLELAQQRAQCIYVGKAAGRHAMSQEEINALLCRLAHPEKITIRLKGGDPFVFGRGGEEAAYLIGQGIQVEIVPGVTAAAGCAAAAGIPLTHRGLATGVRFVTGHCRSDLPLDLDWQGLADPSTTLVFYMGLGQIGEIADQLQRHGLPGSTPVAAISAGTTARQQILRSRLATLASDVAKGELATPTLFILGPVVDVLGSHQAAMDPARLLMAVAGHA